MTPRDTMRLTSFLLRVLWAGWRLGARRLEKTSDIQAMKTTMLDTAKEYLPELKRMKGKTNGHN